MVLIHTPANVDRLEPAGAARTTPAGRIALPVALKDGKYTVATFDLVLDGPAAHQLHEALGEHLAGRGAGSAVEYAARRTADLLA